MSFEVAVFRLFTAPSSDSRPQVSIPFPSRGPAVRYMCSYVKRTGNSGNLRAHLGVFYRYYYHCFRVSEIARTYIVIVKFSPRISLPINYYYMVSIYIYKCCIYVYLYCFGHIQRFRYEKNGRKKVFRHKKLIEIDIFYKKSILQPRQRQKTICF